MKIIQDITIENNVQITRVTIYFPSEILCSKFRKKYEKYVVKSTKQTCSFVFRKTLKSHSLSFVPKTQKDKKFFNQLENFFTQEKLKCNSSQEFEIMQSILNSFLKNENISKTWTSLKNYLQSELKK